MKTAINTYLSIYHPAQFKTQWIITRTSDPHSGKKIMDLIIIFAYFTNLNFIFKLYLIIVGYTPKIWVNESVSDSDYYSKIKEKTYPEHLKSTY